MMRFKLILRRTKSLFWTAFSIVVVLLAAIVGIGQLLMPYSDRYQPQLEQWLTREFGQPVVVDGFEGEWAAFGPRLTLSGIRLLPETAPTDGESPEAEVMIETAALDIRPFNVLLPGRALYNFRVIGAHFELVRDADGEYRLSGFGVSRREGNASALGELARVGEVVLEDSSLDYVDAAHDIRLGVTGIDGRLSLDGNELAARVRARMYDRRSELRYGEVEAALVLTLDDDRRMQSARWQGATNRLMLAAFQGRVPSSPFLPLTGWLDCELWGEWSRETGHRLSGVTDLRDALLSNDYQDLHLERVNYRFQWRFKSVTDWNLHLADFFFDDGVDSWTAPRVSMARNTGRDLGLWISADRLPLGVPVQLTRDFMSVYGTPWPEWLPDSVDGAARELDLVLGADWAVRMLRAEVSGAAVAGWRDLPALAGLNARIDLADGGGTVELDGEQVRLDWPRMFRDPLDFSVPGCTLELQWGGAVQTLLRDCRVENDDLAVAGDMVVFANGGRPAMDADFLVSRGRVGQLDPYWPQGVMPPETVSWLRRGLLGGELEWGRVLISGDLDDWPFRGGVGRFEALARVNDIEIDYGEGWPAARQARATVRFVGAGMDVAGAADDVNGVPVEDIRVAIPDMGEAALEVGWRAEADLPALLDFLENSPLREQVDTDLSVFEFAGSASVSGSLWLPLGDTPGALGVDGAVSLRNGRFSDPQRGVTVDGISGVLEYDEKGFRGAGLDARFGGAPGLLDLRAGAGAEGEEKFRAELSGEFDVANLLDYLPGGAARLRERAHGRSPWRAALVVEAAAAPERRSDVMLYLDSMLGGVTLELPAPLAKPAVELWPFRLSAPIDAPGRSLDIVFEDRAAVRLDLSGRGITPQRGVVRLDGRLDPLPPAGVLRLAGTAGVLDLDGWIDALVDEAAGGAGISGLRPESEDLGARELWFLDRSFDDVGIGFAAGDPDFRIEFSGADIDGVVRYRHNPGGTDNLAAEFERLALAEPRSAGVSMQTDPAELPAVHLYARSFRYGGLELGETRIEAYPTAAGFQFEKVDARSAALSFQAQGSWSLTEAGHRSDFSIHMVSESLGDFLQSMEISSSVQGGQTVVDVDAWWQGSPAEFALSRLNGQVDFNVVQGNISNASAGPGRLLGLVSVQALPRRLALDFRDVFDSGFSFDEASGSFSLENGIAETQDTRLTSSSATIDISGRTDLVERRYDQLMTIRPGLGNTLPIIGALAAGPGGAAAGLALQGLLHQQLGEATQVRYTITGSWDEPVIEPVEVERAGG